jgi:hypothetical protein
VLLGDATVAAEKTLTCSVAILSFATDYYPVATVAMSSIATVAAVATDHAAVAKLSIATVATETTWSVVTPFSQPSQPSQPVKYWSVDLSGIIWKEEGAGPRDHGAMYISAFHQSQSSFTGTEPIRCLVYLKMARENTWTSTGTAAS